MPLPHEQPIRTAGSEFVETGRVLGPSRRKDSKPAFWDFAYLSDIAEFLRKKGVDMGLEQIGVNTWRIAFVAEGKESLDEALSHLLANKDEILANEMSAYEILSRSIDKGKTKEDLKDHIEDMEEHDPLTQNALVSGKDVIEGFDPFFDFEESASYGFDDGKWAEKPQAKAIGETPLSWAEAPEKGKPSPANGWMEDGLIEKRKKADASEEAGWNAKELPKSAQGKDADKVALEKMKEAKARELKPKFPYREIGDPPRKKARSEPDL
jgi:hypothetical protein